MSTFNDFNYKNHGTDTLTPEQREGLEQMAKGSQLWFGTFSDSGPQRAHRDMLCTMLRHIDRLEAENATRKQCSMCGGTAEVQRAPEDWVPCPRCHGNGQDW